MTDRYLDYMPLGELVADPANPKRHDVSGLRSSYARHGYIEPVVIDERTGRLISGHGRVESLSAAHAAGEAPPDGVRVDGDMWLVPVNRGWSSSDDAEARAALVALNRYVEIGGWDEHALADILSGLRDADPAGGLVGTGTDEEYLVGLLRTLDDEAHHEANLPEPGDAPTDATLPQVWGVIVVCEDESEQVELLSRFSQEGLRCRALM